MRRTPRSLGVKKSCGRREGVVVSVSGGTCSTWFSIDWELSETSSPQTLFWRTNCGQEEKSCEEEKEGCQEEGSAEGKEEGSEKEEEEGSEEEGCQEEDKEEGCQEEKGQKENEEEGREEKGCQEENQEKGRQEKEGQEKESHQEAPLMARLDTPVKPDGRVVSNNEKEPARVSCPSRL
jgi:hypothetical protein